MSGHSHETHGCCSGQNGWHLYPCQERQGRNLFALGEGINDAEILLYALFKRLTWSEIEEQGLVLDVVEAASISDVNVCENGWAGEQVDTVVVDGSGKVSAPFVRHAPQPPKKDSILRSTEALWHLQKIWNPSKALFLPECDFLPRLTYGCCKTGHLMTLYGILKGCFQEYRPGFEYFAAKHIEVDGLASALQDISYSKSGNRSWRRHKRRRRGKSTVRVSQNFALGAFVILNSSELV